MSLINEYTQAVKELKAVETAKGHIPDYRFNALLKFAEKRCDDLLDQLYPEPSA